MSCFTHNYLRLSLSSQKFERSNSQILSFAFGFFIYSIIGPDLVSIVDQVLRQAAPWINWVYCFVECSRDFYRENFSPTEPSHQILLSSSLKKVIPSDSNWFQVIPIDSKWFQLIPSDSNWFQVIPIERFKTHQLFARHDNFPWNCWIPQVFFWWHKAFSYWLFSLNILDSYTALVLT